MPQCRPLSDSPEFDVCVIGAGIAGLTTAYLLLGAGKSVAVVERAEIGVGDTLRTTAHLSSIMDDGLSQMEKWHGNNGLNLAYQSHCRAIDRIEQIACEEKIDCDFLRVDGYLFGHGIESEVAAANRAGIPVSKVSGMPGSADSGVAALRFPDQAQFHAAKYVSGLAHAVKRRGGHIFTDTPVTEIEWGEPAIIKTETRHRIKATTVVEAANSLISGSLRTITKLYPYRSYAIAAQLPRAAAPPALFWDTEDPYHYVRIQPADKDSRGPDTLIVGGEDHKTGQGQCDDRYERLERWARERWPRMQAVTHRWSGQILETPDGLALIGHNPGNPKNSFMISGDSGHGITHGTLGGMLVADLILGISNPFEKLYSPERLRLHSLGTWGRENANVGAQYLDWISPSEVSGIDQLKEDQGAIVRDGLRKLAVYKGCDGKVSICSAICPHLGGIVRWNAGEKTWDCPCHGSRFGTDGKRIATPTVADLEPRRRPKGI